MQIMIEYWVANIESLRSTGSKNDIKEGFQNDTEQGIMYDAESIAAVTVDEKMAENDEDANVEVTVQILETPLSQGQNFVENTLQ
ncbi:hypothetical protein TNCV_5009051 [Trichonephila clavipes]|nr:hypothetical protein TNCV_5009051 [Trichonephila clavipes]